MKAVILAGGLGSRLSEETFARPKPMVEIGGRPVLWHILKLYSAHGINEFIICCGYKGYIIKEYFANYFLHMSDVTFNMQTNEMTVHQNKAESWKVTLVDTGETTQTGGRLKRIREYIKDEECFCFTYGDGLGDIDIMESIKFHKEQRTLATVTATYPQARFGALTMREGRVCAFEEKPKGDNGMINGGFFVLSPKVLDYIEGDQTCWENEPLNALVMENQLSAYIHKGFWQPMDTLRDKNHLESLWAEGKAPWKIW